MTRQGRGGLRRDGRRDHVRRSSSSGHSPSVHPSARSQPLLSRPLSLRHNGGRRITQVVLCSEVSAFSNLHPRTSATPVSRKRTSSSSSPPSHSPLSSVAHPHLRSSANLHCRFTPTTSPPYVTSSPPMSLPSTPCSPPVACSTSPSPPSPSSPSTPTPPSASPLLRFGIETASIGFPSRTDDSVDTRIFPSECRELGSSYTAPLMVTFHRADRRGPDREGHQAHGSRALSWFAVPAVICSTPLRVRC